MVIDGVNRETLFLYPQPCYLEKTYSERPEVT